MGDRLHARRASVEGAGQRLQIPPVLAVEPQFVHFPPGQRLAGQRVGDLSLRFAVNKIAGPSEQVVGDAGGSPTATGNLARRLVTDLRVQLAGIPPHDVGQLVVGVKVEVLTIHETIAQGGRQHARAGGRTNHGERLELHVDGAGIQPLTQRDIDSKIFHHRVDELLDRLRQPMDLVDEQD